MSSDVDTLEPIDLAIEELLSALGDFVPADPELGALRVAAAALSNEFALIECRNKIAA